MLHADVAQLVEHNLAKVGVAGSNPVVRSKRNTRSGHCEGSKSAPRGGHEMASVPHLHHISSEFFADRTVDPHILHVRVKRSDDLDAYADRYLGSWDLVLTY